ncbi:MAG: PfkB family carbohydrate kinase [Armatimonadota bacterium]|nr:PfkB family carbohydrate kinase [Armatimonadota bacterium]
MAVAVCFGELLVDMVSDRADASLQEARRFLKAPGGAPANVAVGLARLGVPSAFVGQVGADPFGDWLRGIIAREKVDVTSLLSSPVARTTIAFVATRSDGRKDICFYRNPGADALLNPDDLSPDLLDGARIFHCGSVSLSQGPCREAQLQVARWAVERGVMVSFDPNWRPSLWDDVNLAHQLIWQMIPLSDVVKVADEEWEFITGTTDLAAGAAKIRATGPRLVVVTLGANGAYFDCAGAHGKVREFPVDAIDTLGAGDAFVAGILSQILAHESLDAVLNEATLREIIRFANACGAFATQKPGAIPALPTRSEAIEFMRNSESEEESYKWLQT